MSKTLPLKAILAIWVSLLLPTMALPQATRPTTQPAGKRGTRTPRVKPAVVPFTLSDLVKNYAPVVDPANIAPTPGTANDPNVKVEVFGEPRTAKGHPCTLWDQQDIARFKELLKTDKSLQEQLAAVVGKADRKLKAPLNVPAVHKGADGKWEWPGDFPEDEPPQKNQTKNTESNAQAMDDLAISYILTGDAKYGEYCRKMLLAYAENYPRWGRPENSTWRSAKDGRFSFQFLNDGFVIARFAWAYDLIYDLPSFTAADRKKIHDDFFLPAITPYFTQGGRGPDYLSTHDNRSCICAAAVLIAGYATEDSDMVDFALHGRSGSKLKPVATEGAGPLDEKEMGSQVPSKEPGGLLGVHFSDDCLLPDGLWVEGAPAYTLGIAGAGLFDTAEVLWRHGVDMYRFRNGALKRLLDSGLLLANPDPKLDVPCLRDSQTFSLLDDRDWMNGQIGTAYNFGYERYHEPSYLPIIRNAVAHLNLTTHAGAPLIKDNLPDTKVPEFPVRNVNFYSTGYGILRITGADKNTSLLLQYGQVGDWSSHDHPSALGLDLYTWGDSLMPMPGVIFPYNDPLDPKWYHTTLANCAMEVDMDDQLYAGNRYFKYKGIPKPTTPQLIYAPGATMGMQRAYSSSVYPGTTQDRSLFMTSEYVADLFGGFATVPRTYDLAYHFRGKVSTDLPLEEYKFAEPVPNGYSALDNVKSAETDKAWSANVVFGEKPIRFLAAAGEGTDVIIGDGYFRKTSERPPTIIVRRKSNSTLYGNVIDISGGKEPFVKSITQEGGLDAGYGALKLETTKGTDICFTAYRPGSYKAGGIETDATQAMVTMDGQAVRALYLAGGKSLKAGTASIERSQPGLAYVERMPTGACIIGNPSPNDATIIVTLPGVSGSPFTESMKAGSKIEVGVKK